MWLSDEQRHIAAWVIAVPGMSLVDLARHVGAEPYHSAFYYRVHHMARKRWLVMTRRWDLDRAPYEIRPAERLMCWYRSQQVDVYEMEEAA